MVKARVEQGHNQKMVGFVENPDPSLTLEQLSYPQVTTEPPASSAAKAEWLALGINKGLYGLYWGYIGIMEKKMETTI